MGRDFDIQEYLAKAIARLRNERPEMVYISFPGDEKSSGGCVRPFIRRCLRNFRAAEFYSMTTTEDVCFMKSASR